MWINSSFFSLFLLVMPLPRATALPRTGAPFHETVAEGNVPRPSNLGLASTASSFVSHIKHFLFLSQTSSSDFELWLVEWLVLVESIPVGSSDLVSMLIFLCFPALTVPELPVAFIAWSERVWTRFNNQLSWVFEGCIWVSSSVVGPVMSLRAKIACSGSSREIISRLHVRSSVHHGPGPVAATCRMEWPVSLRDLRWVESKYSGYGFDQLPVSRLTQ